MAYISTSGEALEPSCKDQFTEARRPTPAGSRVHNDSEAAPIAAAVAEAAPPLAPAEVVVVAPAAEPQPFLGAEDLRRFEEELARLDRQEKIERQEAELKRNPWKRLERLQRFEGLALLACDGSKRPVNPVTGCWLKGWQTAAYTPAELSETGGAVQAVGFRPGPDSGGILSLDVDGLSAVAYCEAAGIDWKKVGWKTYRKEAPGRFKVHFRLTEEQRAKLSPCGFPIGKVVLRTKEQTESSASEQVELFCDTGQCVIAGRHPSGGLYRSKGKPAEATAPDDAWWGLLLQVVAEARKRPARAVREAADEVVEYSGPGNPCPVCGRDHDSDCTIFAAEGEEGRVRVLCHIGSSCAPPLTVPTPAWGEMPAGERPIEKGDVIEGVDGARWAFVKRQASSFHGEEAVFVEERPPAAIPTEAEAEVGAAEGGRCETPQVEGVPAALMCLAVDEEAAAAVRGAGWPCVSVVKGMDQLDWRRMEGPLVWSSGDLMPDAIRLGGGKLSATALAMRGADGKPKVVLIPTEVPQGGGNPTRSRWQNTAKSFIERHGADAFRCLVEKARPCTVLKQVNGVQRAVWKWERQVTGGVREEALIAWTVFKDLFVADEESEALHQWDGATWVERPGRAVDALRTPLVHWLDAMHWRATLVSGPVCAELLARLKGKLCADPVGRYGLLPLKSGCLRLETMVMEPHDSGKGITWRLDFDLDAERPPTKTLKCLRELLTCEEDVQMFRAAAAATVRRLGVKAFLEIVGSADSGKSVLVALLQALAGANNVVASKLELLEDPNQRFETAKLVGAGLVVFSEVQRYCGPLETIKAMTGRDPIAAEQKNSRRKVQFVFGGFIVMAGNGPLRVVEDSAAVINRRRTMRAPHSIPPSQQREMLEPDVKEGWRGELASELGAFLYWVLTMDVAEVKQRLGPAAVLQRMDATLASLMAQPFASWCEEYLMFDPGSALKIGNLEGNTLGGVAGSEKDACMYATYAASMKAGGIPEVKLPRFKEMLVSLLRDQLGLPLPPGELHVSPYKTNKGSVLPCVRWRRRTDSAAPGVVRYGMQLRSDRELKDAEGFKEHLKNPLKSVQIQD